MKTKTFLLSLFICAAVLSSCTQQSPPAEVPDSIRREVLNELEQYYRDFSARDWDAFSSHFWPGATLATIWQPAEEDAPRVVITGIDAFIAQAPLGPGSREIFEERMVGAEVAATENLAQVWARYEARFGDPGDMYEWSGIDAFTLVKHDDEWKIVSLSYVSEDEGE